MQKILQFLDSKWFMLILMVAMGVLLPTTYDNMIVVYEGGRMSDLWYIPAVFICNLLTVAVAFWKFMGKISDKKNKPQEQWEED